jgi:hypothetical protein
VATFAAVGFEAELLLDLEILRTRAQLASRTGKRSTFDRRCERASALLVVQLDA